MDLRTLERDEKLTRTLQARHAPEYEPTQAEIAELTAEIRKGWSNRDWVYRSAIGERAPMLIHKLHLSLDMLENCE